MATIRQVPATVLDAPEPAEMTERQRLEAALQRAITVVSKNGDKIAFRVIREDESYHTVRNTFNAVRERVGAPKVNLITGHDSMLYVTTRPPTRGRRPKIIVR